MVLPKSKRHLNAKNTLSDHHRIHGHRNLNYTERSVIARHRNFNASKICKITVPEKVAELDHQLLEDVEKEQEGV